MQPRILRPSLSSLHASVAACGSRWPEGARLLPVCELHALALFFLPDPSIATQG